MSKPGGSATTTTERQIPAWLANALKPLLAQSARGMAQFGAQGQNVLQGFDPGRAAGPIDPASVVSGGGRGRRGGRIGPLELIAARAGRV